MKKHNFTGQNIVDAIAEPAAGILIRSLPKPVKTLGDIMNFTQKELWEMIGMDWKTYSAVQMALQARGLELRADETA